MRPCGRQFLALFSASVTLASSIFAGWILLGIWMYGDMIIYQPYQLILALEIIMATWASIWAALGVVVWLIKGVKACLA